MYKTDKKANLHNFKNAIVTQVIDWRSIRLLCESERYILTIRASSTVKAAPTVL